jgi:hypothetical protein
MTELSEKITKLESLLSQVPIGTPTYKTIKQTLDELKLERDQAFAEASVKMAPPPLIAPDTSSTQTTTEAPEPPNTQTASDALERPVNESIFQAIGIIKGQIETESVTNENGEERILLSLLHQGKRYRVKFDKFKFKGLLKESHKSQGKELYFLVYPYLQFIPKMPPELRFWINAWQENPYENLKESEFILRGIWQFIPQFRRPLITVLRNWMEKESRDKLKEKGVDFKGIHVPLLWKDSQVPPFRFNPKAESQGDRYFVEMKAKFIARLDTFGFVELLSEPTTIFPRHLLSQAKMVRIMERRAERKKKQKADLAEKSKSSQSDPSKR